MLGAHCYVNTVVTAITSKWRSMDEVAEMSLCTSHFPVVALRCVPLPHKLRWRHQNLKNTHSNKACCNVFPSKLPTETVSKCSHFPSVFSHKIDSYHVSRAVFWEENKCGVCAVGVMKVPTPCSGVTSSTFRDYNKHTTLRASGIKKTSCSRFAH